MLANPLPVLLELKDTLSLTPEQVTRIEKISTDLQVSLAKRREDLGRRFDNVQQGAEQGRIFQELQPEIEKTRTEISEALEAVQQILTRDQWDRVPDQIRNPFQPQRGRRGGT
jgi:Spy/CpxP family protein refolding chaperone